MKKDNEIKRSLELYADSFEQKEEVLFGAHTEMSQQHSQGMYLKQNEFKQKRRLLAGISSFAAIAVAFILFFALVLIPNRSQNQVYALNELTSVEIERDDLAGIDGIKYLDVIGADERYLAYYMDNSDKLYVLKIRYLVERSGCTDEIIITIDFYNGLRDNDFEKDYIKTKKVGRKYDNYEDGEYYSYLYLREKKKSYYISVMSPNSGGGNYYEQLI